MIEIDLGPDGVAPTAAVRVGIGQIREVFEQNGAEIGEPLPGQHMSPRRTLQFFDNTLMLLGVFKHELITERKLKQVLGCAVDITLNPHPENRRGIVQAISVY